MNVIRRNIEINRIRAAICRFLDEAADWQGIRGPLPIFYSGIRKDAAMAAGVAVTPAFNDIFDYVVKMKGAYQIASYDADGCLTIRPFVF